MKRKLKMQMTDTLAEIYLSGDVVSNNVEAWFDDANKLFVYPKMVRDAVEEAGGRNIKIHISSNGGDVSAGLEIANYLQSLTDKKVVTMVVDSWAASVASVIALSGSELQMPANTYLMIHNPAVFGVSGDVHELEKTYTFLKTMTSQMAKFYASKVVDYVTSDEATKEDYFRTLMDNETWLTAKQVEDIFKNARVINAEGYSMTAKLENFKAVPKAVSEELMKAKIKANLNYAFK